jgi:hypothetical protein
MEAIFKIQSTELNQELLKKIKKIFKGKTVTITISTELDETDYLNANPANRKHLHESMAQEPTVSFTPEEFDRHVKNLVKNS